MVEPAVAEAVLLAMAAVVLLLHPCHLEQLQLAAGPSYLQLAAGPSYLG